MRAYEYRSLPPGEQSLVLLRIEAARQDGSLREETESGVSSEHALRQFEYACARFVQALADHKPGGKERRGEVGPYLKELEGALNRLKAATDDVTRSIDQDYDQMPERVFDALATLFPNSAEERQAATSYTQLCDDPLEWRKRLEAERLVHDVGRWASLASARVKEVAKLYRAPGRDLGSAESWLASDILNLLRLLDRSEKGPVRPVRPKALMSWVQLAHDLIGVPPENDVHVTCKHAVAKVGTRSSWLHPERPTFANPRVMFQVSIDGQGNATRLK